MGAQYKAGDRVRVVSSPFLSEHRQIGAVGTVSRVPSRSRGDVEIDFEGDGGKNWGFYFREIEHADYKPVKGDRVRVVLEGEVTDDDTSAGFTVEHEVPFFYDDPGLISIEKIEPPVEVFGAGDVVRPIGGGHRYVLGRRDYFDIDAPYGSSVLRNRDQFTSEHYEKVSLG